MTDTTPRPPSERNPARRRPASARTPRVLALTAVAAVALAACGTPEPTPSPPTETTVPDGTTTTTAGDTTTQPDDATTTVAPDETTTTVADDTTTTTAAPAPAPEAWPDATAEETVAETIRVSGTFDGELTRYVAGPGLGDGGQAEGQEPVFRLADGATIENVIIGSPAADGIHCDGECTLRNVWWEDVGEDAATFRAEDTSDQMLVEGGGARMASDKVFQHNGTGTVTIRNFEVEDFGKLYRSCGTCDGLERHVVLEHVTAIAPGLTIVGINPGNGDTARFSDITVIGDMDICQRYDGTTRTGSGPDDSCIYDESDITRG